VEAVLLTVVSTTFDRVTPIGTVGISSAEKKAGQGPAVERVYTRQE
jgi:hypothetical protein